MLTTNVSKSGNSLNLSNYEIWDKPLIRFILINHNIIYYLILLSKSQDLLNVKGKSTCMYILILISPLKLMPLWNLQISKIGEATQILEKDTYAHHACVLWQRSQLYAQSSAAGLVHIVPFNLNNSVTVTALCLRVQRYSTIRCLCACNDCYYSSNW